MSFNCTSRDEILGVDSLALWKIIDEEDAVLIPKNRGENLSSWFFALGIFLGGVSRYAAILLLVASSPGHSDIIRFRPWSPIATGNHLDCAENKVRKLLRRLEPLTFLIRVQAFRDPLRGELPHVQIFINDGPNPLPWDAQLSAIDLAEIRRSSKISSWIWSIVSGVVVHDQAHHRLKNHHV